MDLKVDITDSNVMRNLQDYVKFEMISDRNVFDDEFMGEKRPGEGNKSRDSKGSLKKLK